MELTKGKRYITTFSKPNSVKFLDQGHEAGQLLGVWRGQLILFGINQIIKEKK